MENRYLYRAKRTDNGEWVEGFLIKGRWYFDEREIYAILPMDLCIYPGCEISEWIEIDPSTICQCTGKTDIEKNLIFEHDVVSFLDMTSTDNGYAEYWQVGEVLWDDETVSFQVTERLSAESYEVLDECKVLGNTIDNPELLEQ